MKHALKRTQLVTAMVAVTAVGTPVAAAATTSGSTAMRPSIATANASAGSITATQWQSIAAAARTAGDTVAAQSAERMANKTHSPIRVMALPFFAKQAIKAALKYGKKFLPARIRPYADKLYKVIDKIEDSTEAAVAIALVKSGLPPDLAGPIALWIRTFL